VTRHRCIAAVAAAALIVPATGAAAERCCFLVDAWVSGRLSLRAGADLEAPGSAVYDARWTWNVRHVVRYVEHGRIFSALTRFGTTRQAKLSIRFSEERVGLRASTCRRTARHDLMEAGKPAYVSLEDTTGGETALVARADHPALRARCSPGSAIPTAQVLPAPPGVVLRRARVLSLAWQEPVRLDGRIVGSVAARVRLRILPSGR
jgi:hypothetical protein